MPWLLSALWGSVVWDAPTPSLEGAPERALSLTLPQLRQSRGPAQGSLPPHAQGRAGSTQ